MANRYDISKPVADQLRAVRDDYLMATPDKLDTAYAVMTRGADTVADLLAACQSAIPKNVATDNRNIPDDQLIPLDFTMGELRRIQAAIAKALGSAA